MKLIQIKEAAERLGVNRQTIMNWGKDGTLPVKRTGKTKKCYWVDADTIDAFGDTIQDIEQSRMKLQDEQRRIKECLNKETQVRRDIERELYIIGKFRKSVCYREFYLIIPDMLMKLNLCNSRGVEIMRKIINGEDIADIAGDYYLTVTRVVQIFFKCCREARKIAEIMPNKEELEALRCENQNLKQALEMMSMELKMKEIKDDEERIEAIKQSDKYVKMLDTMLVDCDLSVRALNFCRAAELRTIGDLAKCNKKNIGKFRNAGKKTIAELEDFLNDHGLDFDMDIDNIYYARLKEKVQLQWGKS